MADSNNCIKPPSEEQPIYCPKLGHQLPFSYCRTEDMGGPCFKTLDCWFRYFSVEKYLRAELTAEEWTDTFEKPRVPKMLTLAELITKAKKDSK